MRFAHAGYTVILGSRDHERATKAANDLNSKLPSGTRVSGAENEPAARAADLAILAVPYDGHEDLVAKLRKSVIGKLVVTCVNAIAFDAQGPYALEVPGGSAAEETAALLPDSQVVAAFHHLSAINLLKHPDALHDQDILVCGDDEKARAQVIALCRTITGRSGVDAGRLRMARQLEALTATLISINKRYKIHSGIRITGLP